MIVLALISACSAAPRPATGTGEPMIAKRVAVTWGIAKASQDGERMSDIFLATTDETGKQVSHPVGRYKGECVVIVPAKEMNALSGVACRTGGTGTELHAVVEHGDAVVILQLGIREGVAPDPMAREEVTRVKVPLGAKIEAGS
ncbi:MAG TPA: hypothetical protein VFT22_38875 [Kofleriaceae bacterium]|nr:hypothetical protein [Kofleriaceae bacterium]